jgi:hypothetical protein
LLIYLFNPELPVHISIAMLPSSELVTSAISDTSTLHQTHEFQATSHTNQNKRKAFPEFGTRFNPI